MKKSLSILFVTLSLLGCSSKPDISDIEKQIQTMWQPCKLLKVTDLKKTNGIEQGSAYSLAYSYKLEFLSDFSIGGDGGWPSADLCPGAQINMLWHYAHEVSKRGRMMKKGEFILVNDFVALVKSEKGWIPQ